MEYVVGIIVVVLAVALIRWLLTRRRQGQDSAAPSPDPATAGSTGKDTEPSGGALSHGSLAGPSAKAAGTTGLPGAAGYSSPSAAAPPPTPEAEHDAAVAHSVAAGTPSTPASTPAPGSPSTPASSPAPGPAAESDRQPAADSGDTPAGLPAAGEGVAGKATAEARAAGDRAEWETHWTDAAGTPTPPPSGPAGDATTLHSTEAADIEAAAAGTPYTSGGEAVPAGHLAAEEPYGAGSASPRPDGSGPDGFTVKGDASAMVYFDESDAGYEDAACDVWFLSPAHAEAAGFREQRRIRR